MTAHREVELWVGQLYQSWTGVRAVFWGKPRRASLVDAFDLAGGAVRDKLTEFREAIEAGLMAIGPQAELSQINRLRRRLERDQYVSRWPSRVREWESGYGAPDPLEQEFERTLDALGKLKKPKQRRGELVGGKQPNPKIGRICQPSRRRVDQKIGANHCPIEVSSF
jgi:hypothetical protein